MPEGISPNKLNDISKVYLDQVAAFREIRKQETEKDIERWSSQPEVATEAVLGQDTEMRKVKSAERREQGDTRETPAAARNYAKGQKGSIAWWKNKTRKESFSDWRKELREVSDDEPETEKEAEQKVDVKKNIRNIVKINPTLSDAVEHMGGQLLEVAEVEDDAGEENPALKAKQKQDNMMKRRVLMTKMRALRQGARGIMASYEPDIEGVVEYFYEEGLNEEGIDLLIEEIGLDGFVDFVEESEFLTEEEGRPARRATVRAKKYDVVKKEVDKADAARKASKKGEYAPSYAKKETDVTDYGDDKPAAKKAPAGMKKAVARKKEVLKQPVKKVAPKPVAKKVQKVVAKVKTTQPTKRVKASKEVVKKGIRAKVKSLYDAGKKRHRKATQPIRVFGKGVRRGVGDTVKFAKKAKKAVVGEEESLGTDEVLNEVQVSKLDDKQKKAAREAMLQALEQQAIKKKKALAKEENEIDEDVKSSEATLARKQLVLDRQKLQLRRRSHALAKKEKQTDAGTNADAQANVIAQEAKIDTGTATEKASARNLRNTPPGGNRKFDTSVFITRKPGESLDSARTRKRREAHAAKRGIKEDKAFDNVVTALRKKYGKDAVLTKDSPKPKPQPKPKAKPDTRTPEQKKKDQDHANIMARYGGEANYKAGRGLGT